MEEKVAQQSHGRKGLKFKSQANYIDSPSLVLAYSMCILQSWPPISKMRSLFGCEMRVRMRLGPNLLETTTMHQLVEAEAIAHREYSRDGVT
jgi:hypothetical protein